jgi:STE24 endopeptidase
MRRFPRGWWLGAAGVSAAGVGVLTFLAPVLLDPLFNDFQPLSDGEAREDVLELAQRAGVRVGAVYEVDASRRTRAANAYVSGLGATKRVVLFDTLLESFSREERRLVIAHELAHVRHRDVARGLAHTALSAPGAMYAIDALVGSLERSRPRGRGGPALGAGERAPGHRASAATLPALAVAAGAVGAVTAVLSSALSRRMEARADAFALALTDEPSAFVSFEQRIVRQNLLDPDPPRWLVRLIASHPPTAERIGIALAYERGAR